MSEHIENLANIQVVSSDTNITGLEKLFDEIESNMRTLEKFSVEANSYELLLMSFIMNHFPY